MGPPQMHLAAMLELLDALLFYWDFKTTFVRWYGKFLRLLLGPLIIGETDSLPNPPSKDATKPPQILPSKKLQYPTRLWNAKIFFMSLCCWGYQMRRQMKWQNLSGLGKLLNRQLYLICWTWCYSHPPKSFYLLYINKSLTQRKEGTG